MPSEPVKLSATSSFANQTLGASAPIKLSTSRSSAVSVRAEQNALLPPPPRSLPRFFSSTRASQGSVPVSPYHRATFSQPAVSPRSEVFTVPSAEKKKQEAYMTLFESTIQARASYHPAIQLIVGMRDVLADYIGAGFKHHLMSLTRHHLDAVKARVALITEKLGTLRDPLEARQFLEMQLHELLLVRAIKGTLKDRIDYLIERCREAGYHASNTLVVPVARELLEART